MRRLAVWFVDRIAATVGKSIDSAMSDFHFHLESDSPEDLPSRSDKSSRWDFFDFDDKDDDR